jgi:glycerol kinase
MPSSSAATHFLSAAPYNFESVALAEQRQTAVYWNTDGDLLIRQRCWPDDDALIIAADSVDRFIDKLTDVMGIPSAGKR